MELFTTFIILIAVGLGAGTLGSMIGVGGGIIMVPALTFLGMPPAQTASTSLVAVASTSVSSTIEYSRLKRINYRLGLEMAAFAIPGAVLGAYFSNYLTAGSFKVYFAIILILTGIYVLYKNTILKESEAKKRSRGVCVVIYGATFGAGVISSLFGVGGGMIFVPIMLLVVGLSMQRAAPTSQMTLMITSIAGVFTHGILGHTDYVQAAFLSVGAFAGGQVGARISGTTKEALLQRILGLALIAVAIELIIDRFTSK